MTRTTKTLKTILLTSALAIPSLAVQAVQNGKPESLTDYPSLIEINCSGTIIAGKWIMTAAHCNNASTVSLGERRTAAGDWFVGVESHHSHTSDFSLWKLEAAPLIDKVLFLSNEFVSNDKTPIYTLYGFGQTNGNLHSAEFRVRGDYTSPLGLNLAAITSAMAVPGDSGAPVTDPQDRIVSILTRGSNGAEISTRITYVADFILDTIDGWHYPTKASAPVGQRVTIEVQSLHDEILVAGEADAKTSANLYLDVAASSCMTASSIAPFDTCTYVVVSDDGYESTLALDDDEVIIFNHGLKPTPPQPDNDNAGGSSGGSVGWLSLLVLGGLVWRMRRGQ